MSKLSKIFNKNAIRLTLFGFLFLTLGVIPSLAQSTAKRDSTCICGTKIEIDSALKMLNDYADLKQQAFLTAKVLDNERKLVAIEQKQVMGYLGLQSDWNTKQIKQRVRQWKWRKWKWGIGGIGVGMLIMGLVR